MRAAPAAAATIALLAATPAGADTAYHGFRLGGRSDAALVVAAERQVDLVERAGLSPETLAVLRGFRVQVDAGRGGGHFGRDGVVVKLLPGDDARPILLHELMHVYQARIMTSGQQRELRGFFAAAQSLWPAGSYMLSNEHEYFAMTASTYLNGSAARPPFTRAAIEAKQPGYAAWLARTVH